MLTATFAPTTVYTGTTGAYALNAADLNGDGKLDIITANSNGTVTILLGNGDGTFQKPTTISDGLANGVASMAIGDVNSDGLPDVVVASGGSYGQISLLLNKGAGKFRAPKLLDVAGNHTTSVAIADVNGDSKPDILAANDYGVLSVLAGNGDGTFGPYVKRSLPNATGQNVLAEGDFNGDGKADLAVANGLNSKVTILLGKGNGRFTVGGSAAVGADANSIAVADFNHDGKLDVAVGAGDGTITVLLGNGDGVLGTPRVYTVATEVDAITAGDLDGDGVPDIAFTSHGYYGYGYAAILINNGDGSFHASSGYTTPTKYPQGIVAADFTGDGLDDVASADGTYGAIDFLSNVTDGDPTIVRSKGTVIVSGTNSADSVSATVSGTKLTVTNGAVTDTYPLSAIHLLQFNLFGGNDTVVLGAGAPPSLVNGQGGADSIVANDSAADTFAGGSGNDSISAGSGADLLDGGAGNDTLIAGSGNDTLTGDGGADSLVGGAGLDLLKGGNGNDTLIAGTGNSTLRGNPGADSLDGSGGGSDLLAGNGGADTLIGSTGLTAATDTLNGGGGADSILAGTGDAVDSTDPSDTVGRR